ncbi:MAG: VCBS repeat-containing protein [Planctomycetes bacterium]|nr:VCBS repeat-containing protein [Planctomycetota bacterium]
MGSQFVDLDADGRIDFFSATFDGSPHVAYGVDGGFAEPTHVLDRNGRRVLLDQYWDYDAKKWTNVGGGAEGHCISALLFDWDADGDFDLLLGDKNHGNLYLQLNEGRAGEPAFAGHSAPVLADGAPFALEGGMTAPQLVDWDGDGLVDIVAGSFGDPYGGKPPGGVYLYRNVGTAGAPVFAGAVPLIPPTATTGHEAERPNVGLYPDATDYDGDGDLDLVVGGYAIWTPAPPEMTDAKRARLTELKDELAKVDAKVRESVEAMRRSTAGLDEEAQSARLRELLQGAEHRALTAHRKEIADEIETLDPRQKREAGVWVFLRQ